MKYTQIETVRARKPLIHHITNYVTANDCANITIAAGASPIMADAQEETAYITENAAALVLNMGTLNERTVASMLAAGRAANRAGVPVIFDPVGVGASPFRNRTAARILSEVRICVLRGNRSELRFLAGRNADIKGVDAAADDRNSATDAAVVAKALAARLHCVAALSGAADVISDGDRVIRVENGHPMLACISGTGCMCAALIGAFCGAAPESPLAAAVGAMLTMGIAGELAFAKAGSLGYGSFHAALHDAVSQLDGAAMKGSAKCYEA